jgi:SAM-dependent MidA family methyltransferase
MLPAMSTEEEVHSRAVTRLIRERVETAGGWLPFDEFMELALYAPGLGYYSAGGVKIGAGGDFTTAPEVSDLFSRCVARQVSEVLERTGGSVLELGAGTGRMAAAVLRTLASLECLPEQYAILEVSADLRERQRARIEQLPAELRDRVTWLDALPAKPMRGVILANEVLDALPCARIVIRGNDARELGVGLESADGGAAESYAAIRGAGHEAVPDESVRGSAASRPGADFVKPEAPARSPAAGFLEAEAPARSEVAAAWHHVRASLPFTLEDGYRTELCTRIEPWIASLADSLEAGLVLLFDYGLPRAHYYHPQRTDGTLRCHFKQRAHDDPYINVGVQDITAWVDFTRVAEAADSARLEVSGFATQAAFLLGLGIESLISDVRRASEARKLLMPGEMGEAFKAMALTRAVDIPLSGFSVQDLRHSL